MLSVVSSCPPGAHLRCLACPGALRSSRGVLEKLGVRYKHRTLKKSYQALGLTEDCEDEELRLAFVHLAKQYHPDSGCSGADAHKFSEVEGAYRMIQRQRNLEKDRGEQLPDVEHFDIQHTAPQHRHFLSYDTGRGTLSQRQRRFTVERAQKAVENVMEHRLKKIQAAERNTLVGKDKTRAKDIKTRYGIDRLVEDYIQEAMNKGEFSQLSGMGKPLKDRSSSQNPHVDFVTHKLNEILIDNGFTPEWIQLSKEIREESKDLQDYLNNTRETLGAVPFTPEDLKIWGEALNSAEVTVKRINDKINKYNLLVPILQKQMVQINLKNLEKKALERPPNSRVREAPLIKSQRQEETSSIFDFFMSNFESKKN
ncbi:dnaJ homolog subfamily C member 28 [Diachasma alloeum]|uniref:dnaJ homolog subfamily C member 28 n=1 Tax=Diachasma alloeum TaxID=454923 RepID=UPI0007382856|nr:dnaJ homolog subfamily C member 28 [Diachasma alloeum]